MSDEENKKELVKTTLESSFNFDILLKEGELDNDSEFFKILQMKLGERIKFFIRTDIDKLFQAFYKIDLHEAESDAAFDLGEINKVSAKLAELIIIRQLEKVQYSREFYKKK